MRYRMNSRYINNSVGIMVMGALAAFAVFIILAGRAQGWFEGSIEISAIFTTPEGSSSNEQGSFGLEEGNEVRVRSTRAGHVASIEPGEDGGLQARLVIKKRFHRYIKRDSRAWVKKKLAVTGDSFVEISGGTGDDIRDGDTIACFKDEELFEMAQRAVDQIQEAVVPMLTEATGVLSNANRISLQISGGDGIVGAAISDGQMRSDIKQSIKEMNLLISTSREAVSEAARLIKGAQKSWLVRKYIPDRDEHEYLSPLFPLYGRLDDDLINRCRTEHAKAGEEGRADEIFRTAYNMAICCIRAGDDDKAQLYIQEASIFTDGTPLHLLHLSAGNLYLKRKNAMEQNVVIKGLLAASKPKAMSDASFSEFMALAILSGLESDRQTAVSAMKIHNRLIQKKGTEPARAAFYKTSAMLIADSDPAGAAKLADIEMATLSEAGLSLAMADAAVSAGDYYILCGRHDLAALRYLTAGISLSEQGYSDRAVLLWSKASTSAQLAGLEELTAYIEAGNALNSAEIPD